MYSGIRSKYKSCLSSISRYQVLFYLSSLFYFGLCLLEATIYQVGYVNSLKKNDRDLGDSPIVFFLGLTVFNWLWMVLSVTFFILTILGVRRGSRFLAHAYPIFVGLDLRVFFNDFMEGMIEENAAKISISIFYMLMVVVVEMMFTLHWRERLATRKIIFRSYPPPV